MIGSAPGATDVGLAAGGGGAARGIIWGGVGAGASGAGDLVGPGGTNEGPAAELAGDSDGLRTWGAIDGGTLTGLGVGAAEVVVGGNADSIFAGGAIGCGGIGAVADVIAGAF